MPDVLAITAPIYLLIGAGWLAARAGAVPEADLAALGRVVLALCLPALIFRAVLSAGGGAAIDSRLVGASVVAALPVLVLGAAAMRMLGHPPAAAWVLALGTAAPNSAFVGLPTATFAFGAEPAGAVFAQLLVAENLVIIPAALVLADLAAGGGGTAPKVLRNAARRMARNPLLWAVVLAVAALAFGLRPPEPLDRALALLAAVAPGAALLVVGGAMAGQPLRGAIAPALVLAAGKLAVHPLAVLAALALFDVQDDRARIALVFAAAPMISVFPILAARHAGASLPATAMVVATTLSFASVSLVLAFAG